MNRLIKSAKAKQISELEESQLYLNKLLQRQIEQSKIFNKGKKSSNK